MAERLLLRHTEPVLSVHFTGDGARVVTATDQSATIWDTATGAALYTTNKVGNGLADALLLPGDRQLFQAGVAFGESALVDLQTEYETTTFEMIQAQCAAWVPGGRGILIASWDDHLCGAAQLLDRDDLRIVRTYQTGIEGSIGRVAVSEDGAHFLAAQACFSVASGTSSDDRAFLLATDTGALEQTFCGPSTWHDLAFAPGEQNVVGCADTGLWWWNLQRATLVDQYRDFAGSITSLAVAPARTPNQHLLAGGCEDGTVVVWHWPDLRALYRFHDHTGRVNHITFAQDGLLVASASEDGTVSLRHLDR
jgi:WD40 repeat protein